MGLDLWTWGLVINGVLAMVVSCLLASFVREKGDGTYTPTNEKVVMKAEGVWRYGS